MNIRRDDKVIVLSGKDRGKEGKVLSCDPKNGKAVVEGVNVASRHVKPKKQGQPGGIIKQETPIYVCKLMLICPKCGKPTRPARRFDEALKKFRVCKKCGADI